MAYCVEQFVKKINNPIICVYKNNRLSFCNGLELSFFEFDNKVSINEITIENNNVLIQVIDGAGLITNESWIEEHMRVFGHEPSLFDGA